MKQKIIITNKNRDIIFEGKPYDLPIHYEEIKKKSIELFNDDEPCIIHQSYAIQKIIDTFMKRYKGISIQELKLSEIKEDIQFIKIDHIEDLYLTIQR